MRICALDIRSQGFKFQSRQSWRLVRLIGEELDAGGPSFLRRVFLGLREDDRKHISE